MASEQVKLLMAENRSRRDDELVWSDFLQAVALDENLDVVEAPTSTGDYLFRVDRFSELDHLLRDGPAQLLLRVVSAANRRVAGQYEDGTRKSRDR